MENRIKADLHNHLGRYGTFESFNHVIDVASERLGKNGILGIANCDDFRYERFAGCLGYERINLGNAIYIPKKEILVVRGQEVFTEEAHVLILGLQNGKNIQRTNLENVLKEAQDLGAIKIADHPFYKKGLMSIEENLKLLDYFNSWEVYNSEAELWILGVSPKNANLKSLKFYIEKIKDNYDIGSCSFTDGHSTNVLGRSYTWLPFPNISSMENLLESLKKDLRETKDIKYLVMRPSKLAALKHLVELKIINKLFPIKVE